MVLFWPIQQELDCISDSGNVLGKIKFDGSQDKHIFYTADETVTLSNDEKAGIAARLAGLDAGAYSIPMQDDD
ncbi:hypothetical protein A3742_11140 [Oleiphilus sp. HI0071]|uniref:hypothetical protein n=1 Tax=unclassified Oleiphilus TaxID=2631174 RepID=UPI0007C34266|nr:MULTISPECIES: hypothetical protein [unclassified Oleiphilus]KZY62231.1 hypothetical protein A3737_04385 [Oleiphilus sp. HI0065]KZY81689.1 hypothetical protein A3742_11140 [Oleiphilus sp. HI0071]KZY91490.1 hypothetical protein A3744_20680 [Oleiphilus sp. HI0073]KZZ48214.1 hypothetical protein A3760_04085 [Oleiphilus sp. HI0122]KZZ48417.1 hypothetical protein A3758_01550 [Oleiphilus sp. HI0118]KZZ69586.1 hypothetical protein A3765_17270 [Oleiphilus sp. HI0130]KZZ76185.1 hypothetical protein